MMRAYATVIPTSAGSSLPEAASSQLPRTCLSVTTCFSILGRVLYTEGGWTAGSGTKIDPHTTIWTSNPPFGSDAAFRTQGSSFAPVHIGRDVWIPASESIVAGMSSDDGAVLGAGSIVTREVEPISGTADKAARMIRSSIR